MSAEPAIAGEDVPWEADRRGASTPDSGGIVVDFYDLWKRRIMEHFQRDPVGGRALMRVAPDVPQLGPLRHLLLDPPRYRRVPPSAPNDVHGWLDREGAQHRGFYVAIADGDLVDRDVDARALDGRLAARGLADVLVVRVDDWLGR